MITELFFFFLFVFATFFAVEIKLLQEGNALLESKEVREFYDGKVVWKK